MTKEDLVTYKQKLERLNNCNKNDLMFYDYYKKGFDTDILPVGNEYDFLLERNKDHMDNVALSFENKKITFEELHEKIDEYARALYKIGIRKGDPVGVCVVNTPESVYLVYALNKLGALTIGLSPLNNEYKMARDIELTKPKTIITVDMFYSKMKNICHDLDIKPIVYSPLLSSNNTLIKAIYDIKQIKDGNKFLKTENRLDKIVKNGKDFESVVYPKHVNGTCTNIMFTGGSSGVHKGVELDGNGLNCVVKSLDHVLLLEPGMKHLGNIPFGHMCFGRLVLHYCLCKNVEYALTLKAMPNDFLDEMVRLKVNGAMGGPVHWEALIDNPKLKKDSLSNLIQPLSGGEMFKPVKLQQANEALKYAGCRYEIGNGLGSTETWAPTHVCVGGINTAGSIGYQMPFINSKIVDPETMKEVENGKEGILLINTPGMMLGYYNNEKESANVFSYDENGIKWYNTKDIVKRNENGEFVYIGRKKRNFVSNVDNIYPEQIEQMLLAIPEIREIIVTPIPDDKQQFLPKYHISLYDKDTDTSLVEKKIYDMIFSTLGESALPGYIQYYYEPLPRTDNQKLNSTLLGESDIEQLKVNKLIKTNMR